MTISFGKLSLIIMLAALQPALALSSHIGLFHLDYHANFTCCPNTFMYNN